MKDEIKEILDTPIFIIDDEGFTVYINDKINDCITNLLEENEEIKNTIDFIDNKYKNTINYNEKLIEYNQDYKSRNEKAIEYIEERKNLNWYADGVFVYELLNILQGSDKDE